MADLFGEDRIVVSKHLANIYTERELTKEATCEKIAEVQIEGNSAVNRLIEFYNLDAIILPSTLSEQQKIAYCLSSLDALITAQAKKIVQLKLHKKGE